MTKGLFVTLRLSCLAAAALLSVVACNDSELKEEFVQTSDEPGLVIKGQQMYDFGKGNCQLGYRESAHEFRVSDDTMSEYLVLTLEKEIEVDEECSCSLTYTTKTDIITRNKLRVKLLKKEKDAIGTRMWFWNKSDKMGITVSTVDVN